MNEKHGKDEDPDRKIARAFEQGELDTPRIRKLEEKAFRTVAVAACMRYAARHGLMQSYNFTALARALT